MRFSYILLCLGWAFGLGAQTELPPHFIDELLLDNLIKPVGITFDHLGEAYVWEKDGLIWRMTPEGDKSAQPLLDLREEVAGWGDHGLVGFALDPYFDRNGWYYVFYAVDRHHLLYHGSADYDPGMSIPSQATIARITRYTADSLSGYRTTLAGSRKVILGQEPVDGLPILMGSHATGSLAFGSDGSLLFSFGDGASFSQIDTGNARDTYHVQALADGIIQESDNVGSFKAMQLGTPNGKLSRIDPKSGAGLPSNPFFDPTAPRSHRSRTWALGMRNPYKFIHVNNTGSHLPSQGRPGIFLVGDVGGAQWEELNIVREPGEWFGWPIFEGHDFRWGATWRAKTLNRESPNPAACREFFRFNDLWQNENREGRYLFVNPCDNTPIPEQVITFVHRRPGLCYSADKWNPPARTLVPGFDHRGRAIGVNLHDSEAQSEVIEGGSIIPAAFNNFDGFPEEFRNKLFVGDYRGFITMVTLDDDYTVTRVEPFMRGVQGVTDFAFHPPSGDLYYVNHLEGELRRISYGGILPPQIETRISPPYGASPLEVEFDSRNTRAFDGSELRFEWDFGDGEEATGALVKHVFRHTEARSFDVTLVVTDLDGRESRKDYVISVNNTPPNVQISSIKDGSTYSVQAQNTFELAAVVSDLEHAEEDLTFAWRVDLYHDEHYHLGTIDPAPRTWALLDPVGCGQEKYWYRVNLTVTDPAGLATTDYVEIFPYCGPDIATFEDLTATATQGAVRLDWRLSTGHHADRLIPQRLIDGVFTDIADVGAEVDRLEYTHSDIRPNIGFNEYRLRAEDRDGNYSISQTVTATYTRELPFLLYPIPARQRVSIIAENPDLAQPQWTITDMTGRLMLEGALPEMAQIREVIPLDNLAPGLYFFELNLGGHEYCSTIVTM